MPIPSDKYKLAETSAGGGDAGGNLLLTWAHWKLSRRSGARRASRPPVLTDPDAMGRTCRVSERRMMYLTR